MSNIKYLPLFRKLGIKVTFVAKKLDMGESLLRYHLTQKEVDPEIVTKLHRLLYKMGLDLVKVTRGDSAEITVVQHNK